MENNQLVTQQTGVTFTNEQIETIKNTIAKGATNDELQLFINQCKRTGLDPFSRQIYFSKDKSGKVMINSTIDGQRVVAERSKKYRGQKGPFWCGNDGKWVDVWLKKEAPAAAKVGVIRSDFDKPVYAIATWDGYAQKTYDGKLIGQWAKNPANQLAKCAEALALRKAFPQDLSGIYTEDEISDEPKKVADVTPKITTEQIHQITELIKESGLTKQEVSDLVSGKKANELTQMEADQLISHLAAFVEKRKGEQIPEEIEDQMKDELQTAREIFEVEEDAAISEMNDAMERDKDAIEEEEKKEEKTKKAGRPKKITKDDEKKEEKLDIEETPLSFE